MFIITINYFTISDSVSQVCLFWNVEIISSWFDLGSQRIKVAKYSEHWNLFSAGYVIILTEIVFTKRRKSR